MNLRNYIQFKRVFSRFHSSLQAEQTTEQARTEIKVQTPNKKLLDFFKNDKGIQKVLRKVAPKYLQISKKKSHENYLICPKTAKTIVDKILPFINNKTSCIISEVCPGPALISQELLDRGTQEIRLYESSCEFHPDLKEIKDAYPHQAKLYNKSLSLLHRYEYIDKRDNGNRVETLLSDVPFKPWNEDPVMTIIGSTKNLIFLKHLLRTTALQTGLVAHGRVQMFILMLPRDYAVLSATRENNLKAYQKWTILFNLFFNHQFLGKFPKEVVVPWISPSKSKYQTYLSSLDPDHIYLVEVTMKKELPVPANQLLHLYYFVRNLYGSGVNRVIPTLEKWVPKSGLNIIFPTLKHEDYYPEFDIYTLFRDLTPHQVLAVYRETTNSTSYSESPFFEVMENELQRTETTETCMADPNLGKQIQDDIDEIIEDEQGKE